MNRRTKLLLAAAPGCGLAAYALAVRPWMLRWGASDFELKMTWPGDELTPHSSGGCTRAITIQAPSEQIWPWIMQIGQDRAGFYSYTWLENLFRAEMRNTYRLVPAWQNRSVGEEFWMAAKHRYGGQARMVVARLEPARTLVLVTPQDARSAIERGYAPNGNWSFNLRPAGAGATRLIMRSVDAESGPYMGRIGGFAFFEPAHFIMERKMMLRIKALAEGRLAGLKIED
jgi:hypothetical protein